MTRLPALACAWLVGCAPLAHTSDVADVADALTALSGGDTLAVDHWREQLASYVHLDGSTCLPSALEVLAPPGGPLLERTLRATMPHYGVFYGPAKYRVGGGEGWWMVRLVIAVEIEPTARMELPDCALEERLGGEVRCDGTPYADAEGLWACPEDGGTFEAPGTRDNQRALLAYWSQAVEAYWNRDAEHYRLPVRYDFEFVDAHGGSLAGSTVDLRVPLRTTCGRSPYFRGMRTGWSIPIVAHEIGHYLGLLDEYEPLSGITSLYPKTPFEGSEISRMGVSMKRTTRLLPFHHYLVLRRYHCDEERPPRFDVLSPP